MYKSLIFLSILSLTVECGSTSILFTKTGSSTFNQKPNDCNFDVLTENPTRKSETIGVIDMQASPFGGGWVTDLGTFKEKARPYVCANGGDAVLVKNSSGLPAYMNGSIIKYLK